MKPPPRSRASGLQSLGCVAVAIVAFCGGCPYVIDDRPLTNIRIARLERELAERLPVGSTEADARDWYAARGMSPSYTARPPDMKNSGLMGHLSTANIFGFHEARIMVYVHFDDAGRVASWSVSRFGSSL